MFSFDTQSVSRPNLRRLNLYLDVKGIFYIEKYACQRNKSCIKYLRIDSSPYLKTETKIYFDVDVITITQGSIQCVPKRKTHSLHRALVSVPAECKCGLTNGIPNLQPDTNPD